MSNSPTITMNLDTFDAMRNAVREAEMAKARLAEELIAARLEHPDGRLREMTKLTRAALEIVRFAVGNIHPGSGLRWPAEALAVVSEAMSFLPDYSVDDREMALEFKVFAREAAKLNASRSSQ